MQQKLEKLQNRIGYQFKDKELLVSALMHSSYTYDKHLPRYQCNERLEFLGDAVLEIVSSEFLFFTDEQMPEGELSKLRASIVCESTLAFCAREIHLSDYLLLGRCEEMAEGRSRASITSDAFEALIGAIYLDGGFANAKEFILKFVLNDLEHKKLFFDSKTILQEFVQKNLSESMFYRLIKEEGPDHNKSFFVEVYIGKTCYGKGVGRSKKAAEQEAAYRAILKLHKKNIK